MKAEESYDIEAREGESARRRRCRANVPPSSGAGKVIFGLVVAPDRCGLRPLPGRYHSCSRQLPM